VSGTYATAFDVLAEPGRRRLLELLLDGPRAVGELVVATGLSQPSTSRHLRILRDAQLVRSRTDGQRRLYELRPDGFADVAVWLAPYVRLWQASLDALGEHLDRQAGNA
jgi:DNA-binding transcriptional ArsR family regulator